jgi:predicted nucleic acid-binding Zn ribbon protein
MNKQSNRAFDAEQEFEDAEFHIRQRQVFKRQAKKASDLISHVLARSGVANREGDNQLQEAWDSIVGVTIANCCRVGGLRRGVLEIVVSNSSLSQQLSFKKHEILQVLQKQFPQNSIRELRFRIGSV